jgi:transposase
MSLKPSVLGAVPEETARVARAAFPKGNLYLAMRDELGIAFSDADFAELFPRRGQPALAPWRLALITVMQFLENLSDRQAADAVRSRIDWKYVLGLELTDAGFDYSVLSGFRERLTSGGKQALLLDRMLELFKEKKLLKARTKQRTDSTHVLAAIRVLNRLEMVIETMRAALNQVATTAPDWLAQVSIPEWFERYSRRAEQSRLPTGTKAREAFAARVGEDGFRLLKLLGEAQSALLKLEKIETLRKVWQQHYTRNEAGDEVRWRHGKETLRAAASIESPYDTQAKYSRKDLTKWTGYKVHISETCDEQLPHLITNVHTTVATTQDVASTADIQKALGEKGLLPSRHLVDAGYVDGDLLVQSLDKYNIELFGPTRINSSWQRREGGLDATQFEVDWDNRKVLCPAGKLSADWVECQTKEPYSRRVIKVKFRRKDCFDCENRARCVRSKTGAPRQLLLQAKEFHEALKATRAMFSSEEGRREYQQRAGIEATLSQGIRRGTVRRSRYIGLQKTHLQEVATAAGINILRSINFLHDNPVAKTRVSRFAMLAH